MDYEKEYKEALERARQFSEKPYLEDSKGIVDYIFPELKESEDERIRKELICFLETEIPQCNARDKYIAWLEKQGEQKPAEFDDTNAKRMFIKALERVEEQNAKGYKLTDCDKNSWWEDFKAYTTSKQILANSAKTCKDEQKPTDGQKFKVGDWVIDKQGIVHQIANVIENVTNHTYAYDIVGGGYFNDNTEGVRLWTIQDAKDGDVLAWNDSKCIVIFKNIYDEDSFNSYGFVGGCTGIFESRQSYHDIEGAHPAAKEQRDTLMKAMADAGYEWNADKKELKKIEQKLAWSEEDEEMYKKVETAIDSYYAPFSRDAEEMSEWFKNLKDRVQPKQVWSEDDEQYLEDTLNLLEGHRSKNTYGDVVEWLKSLKGRYAWKPSKEQMEVLLGVKTIMAMPHRNYSQGEIKAIESLYEQLKAL